MPIRRLKKPMKQLGWFLRRIYWGEISYLSYLINNYRDFRPFLYWRDWKKQQPLLLANFLCNCRKQVHHTHPPVTYFQVSPDFPGTCFPMYAFHVNSWLEVQFFEKQRHGQFMRYLHIYPSQLGFWASNISNSMMHRISGNGLVCHGKVDLGVTYYSRESDVMGISEYTWYTLNATPPKK